MSDFENISISELLTLNEEEQLQYFILLRSISPINVFKGKDYGILENATFGKVSYLKKLLSNGTLEDSIDAICLITDEQQESVLSTDCTDVFQFLNWIRTSLMDLLKREEKILSSKPDPELLAAGLEDMQRFGDQNILIDLAERFSRTPEQISEWSYSQVFTILWRDKIQRGIQDNLTQMRKVKNG